MKKAIDFYNRFTIFNLTISSTDLRSYKRR